MKPRSAAEIRDKLYLRNWGVRELRFVREQFSDKLVFDALFGVFTDESRPDSRYDDQDLAGKVLLELKPECHLPLPDVIARSLPLWDNSVEELPYYLAEVFGKDAVLKTLAELESSEDLSAELVEKMETYRFWLKGK